MEMKVSCCAFAAFDDDDGGLNVYFKNWVWNGQINISQGGREYDFKVVGGVIDFSTPIAARLEDIGSPSLQSGEA